MAVALANESDVHKWHVTLAGPPQSIYAGGTFAITIDLPTTYPFKPPLVKFATRIYHPNITNDSLGNICLAILKGELSRRYAPSSSSPSPTTRWSPGSPTSTRTAQPNLRRLPSRTLRDMPRALWISAATRRIRNDTRRELWS
jgi:ubiquitin-protein ligase